MLNSIKGNYITTSIEAEKAFNKNQHLIIKNSSPSRKKEIFLKLKITSTKSLMLIWNLMMRDNAFPKDREQDKDVCSHPFYSTLYWKP